MHLELGYMLKERWLNCWSLGILLAIFMLIKQTHSSGAIGDVEHNLVKAPVRASSGQGLIKMCPPGGEVFQAAWQISCGMKKRRKRSIFIKPVKREDNNEYRALSLSEMMKYCCMSGCSFRDLLAYCDPFGDWDS